MNEKMYSVIKNVSRVKIKILIVKKCNTILELFVFILLFITSIKTISSNEKPIQ